MQNKESQKKSNELLLCPFCGGEAEIHSICSFRETGGDEMFFAMCGKCLTRTRYFGTEKSAILTWNNRKPLERIIERLEEEKKFYNSASYTDQAIRQGVMIATEIVREEGGMND